MLAIATGVQWDSSPKMYFDFSYEKKRDGSTQYYAITVSCRPLTGSSYFGYPIYLKISLDGIEKTSYTLKGTSPSQWSSAITSTTDWLAVPNKTSGKTALSIRAYSGMGTSRDITYDYTLDIDPAASTIEDVTGTVESNPTIRIASASPDFTHTISYSFGNLKDDIAVKTRDTTITDWTIPYAFYSQIPNDKYGVGTLTCTTYSGDTVIGTNESRLTVNTDERECKPTVSGSVVDINEKTKAVTGDPRILVRFCSTALCTLSATRNKEAGSFQVRTINNTEVSEPDTTLEIPNVAVGTFDFYAKDSRGYFNKDKVAALALVPYKMLTANVTAWRVDPTSGNAVLKVEGNYFKGSFGAKDNFLKVEYRQGSSGNYQEAVPVISDDNTYTAEVFLERLEYTKAFDYEVVVSDALNTLARNATIKKGIPVFDWGEGDFAFHVPVSAPSLNQVFMRTAYLGGTNELVLQSRFAAFTDVGNGRQSVFLFGMDNGLLIQGLIGVNDAGAVWWSGTDGVSVAAGDGGTVVVNLPIEAWDWFTLLSAEEFSVV